METMRPRTPSPDRAHEILLAKLEEAKVRNPRLSLRAFAQRLGVSSGALSEILAGKRAFTAPLKKKIADKLMLSPQETVDFFREDLPERMHAGKDERLTLSQDQFHLISDWWYFALLSLLKTRDFRNSTKWMAKRLGLAATTIGEAWERLCRLGYVERKGGQVVTRQPFMKTTDGMLDLSIRKSHLEDLKLIEHVLHEVPLELRDNTSVTFVLDKKDLPKAKEMIRIFQQQFLKQVAKEPGDEVYKLSVSLFPLTQDPKEH